jgi:hypothetical protein
MMTSRDQEMTRTNWSGLVPSSRWFCNESELP